MKAANKEEFEKMNMFGTGIPNDGYAQYFDGKSFLNPLVDSNTSPLFPTVRTTRRGVSGCSVNSKAIACPQPFAVSTVGSANPSTPSFSPLTTSSPEA